MKNIKYTNHAIMRKFERDISDDEINKALSEPDYTLTSVEGRKIAIKKVGERTISVVYKEGKTHINVITVY